MSDFDYPHPVNGPFGPFAEIDACSPPIVPTKNRECHLSLDGDGQSHQRLSSLDQTCMVGPTKVVVATADGSIISPSFNNGREYKQNPATVMCFCPGVDAVRIGWEINCPEAAGEATLEVFAARLEAPVAAEKLDVGALGKGAISGAGCLGSIGIDELEWNPDHEKHFPNSVFTVEYSPYQVRLTVKPESSVHGQFPSVAWTFFHVLVHSIEVVVGDVAQIPPRSEKEGGAASLAEDVAKWERDLVGKLQLQDIKAETVELPLRCEMVTGVPPEAMGDLDQAQTGSREKGSHYGLTATWGKGPRVPLKAKVLLRSANGSAADIEQSGPGLGQAWFLWDWRDNPDKWQDWLEQGDTGNTLLTRNYIESRVTVVEKEAPLGSTNCPKQFGGKRGDSEWPVFPAMEAAGKFGYEVTPAGKNRPWAAFSRGGTGKLMGSSGVIFQPSCIVGDQYRIRVWLTSPPVDTDKDDKPMLARPDLALDGETPRPLGEIIDEANHPPPGDVSGTFQVYRHSTLTVAHLVAEPDQTLIEGVVAYYKKALGFILDWEQADFEDDYLGQDGQQGTHWEDILRDVGGGQIHQRYCGIIHWGIENQADLTTDGTLAKSKSWDQYLALIRGHLNERRAYAVPATRRRLCLCYLGQNPDHTYLLLARANGKDLIVTDRVVEYDNYLRIAFREHLIQREDPPQGLSSHNVKVIFEAGGQRRSYPIIYPKVGRRQKRSRSLPQADRNGLVEDLKLLADALPAGAHRLTIRYKARNNNSRNRVRCERLAAALNEILAQRYHPLGMSVDELMETYLQEHFGIFGMSMTPMLYYSQIFKMLKDAMSKNLQRARFRGLTPQRKTASFVEEEGSGVLYIIWGPACSYTTGNDGAYLNNACDCYHGCIHHHRAGETLVSKQLNADEHTIMVHELGHAFWRPHAVSRLFDVRSPSEAQRDHLIYDTCVMNYDPEPTAKQLCGKCILQARGWLVGDGTHDLADAKGWLEQEIRDCGDDGFKAWKQMRRARLADDQVDARTWIDASLTSGRRLDSASRISLLREAIEGLRKNGGEVQARELWDELKERSEVDWDRCDARGRPLFDD